MSNLLVSVLGQIGALVMMVSNVPEKPMTAQPKAFEPSAGCQFANFDIYDSQEMQLRRDLSRSEYYFLND